ncbi:Low molecular weight protein-tyrosine-phosphatase YfkJ [Linum perenne]
MMKSVPSSRFQSLPPNSQFYHLPPTILLSLNFPFMKTPLGNLPRFHLSFNLPRHTPPSHLAPSSMAETHSTTKPFSVLFVCLGNICRSPAAEGVFRDIVHKKGLDSKFNIDSAGTINYHEVVIRPIQE